MTHRISVSKLTLDKHPEDYEDIFMILDGLALKLLKYSSDVLSDGFINDKYPSLKVMITTEMSRGQIHEMFFTPMRVAWAMEKGLEVIVADMCENHDMVMEHVKLVRDTCGIPNPIFEEELRIANEIMDEIISEEKTNP